MGSAGGWRDVCLLDCSVTQHVVVGLVYRTIGIVYQRTPAASVVG